MDFEFYALQFNVLTSTSTENFVVYHKYWEIMEGDLVILHH